MRQSRLEMEASVRHIIGLEIAASQRRYIETRKNEALFREYVKACEQTPACWNLEGVEQTNCVRKDFKHCYIEMTKENLGYPGSQ